MSDLLGYKLKKLRVDMKLSQEQVAERIGVNKRQISAYETNSRQPSYDILIRLASLYQVTTDYLLGCQSSKRVDVSELTGHEVNLISQLVTDMSTKNVRLKKYEKK